MNWTRGALVVALATLVSTGLAGARGAAQESDSTPCTAEFDLTLSPGLSNTPSSGTFTSGGETGTIECQGNVNGKKATGPGTFGSEGRYGTEDPDTCTSGGEGEAIQTFTVPTVDGDERVVNEGTITYGALEGGGLISGRFRGPRFSGTFEVTPTKGDCVTEPVTEIHVSLEGTLTN